MYLEINIEKPKKNGIKSHATHEIQTQRCPEIMVNSLINVMPCSNVTSKLTWFQQKACSTYRMAQKNWHTFLYAFSSYAFTSSNIDRFSKLISLSESGEHL